MWLIVRSITTRSLREFYLSIFLKCAELIRPLSDEVSRAQVAGSSTVFTKIINKEIPAVILHEDDKVGVANIVTIMIVI